MKKFSTIIIAFYFLLSSCGGKGEKIEKAVQKGERDAIGYIELSHKPKVQEMVRQDYILNVRHNENIIRKAGYEEAADSYIESFKSKLLEKDSVLYYELVPHDN